jgi:hypothetical protein
MAQQKNRRSSAILVFCMVLALLLAPVLLLLPSAASHKYPFELRVGNRSLFMGRYEGAWLDPSGSRVRDTVWNGTSGETCGGWSLRLGFWDYDVSWSVKEPYRSGMTVIKNRTRG